LEEKDYKLCEEYVLADYQSIKDNLTENDKVVCQHIGTFSQDMLISIVSLLEHSLIQDCETIRFQKRLTYLVIECIQNIILHSNKIEHNFQLAYILIIKNEKGYRIHSSNSFDTKNTENLIQKLDNILKEDLELLSKLFSKRIKNPKINEEGHGGIGLLTMVEKTGKEFNYKVKKVTPILSFFSLQLNLNFKNYR